MKLNKAYMYPFIVMTLVGFIVLSIFYMVHKMGLSVNPPQPHIEIEGAISPYVVWESEGEWWSTDERVPFSIFDSKPPQSQSDLLKNLLAQNKTEMVLLNIKSDIGKEKVLSLLSVLAEHPYKMVYIVSPFENSISNLKRVEPRFWYAPSPKAWIKWSVFASFYIETIYGMKSDFLFIDEDTKSILSPRLLKEVQRRNLLVFQTVDQDLEIQYGVELD